MNWLQQVYLVFSQSRQPLYHFTPFENAYEILKTNTLKKSSKHGNLSFTRNKNLEWHKGDEGILVRFEINQDKLRQKYKVKPFVYEGWRGIRTRHYRDWESEEIVTKDINNFGFYINEISFINLDFWAKRAFFVLEDDIGDFESFSETFYDNKDFKGEAIYSVDWRKDWYRGYNVVVVNNYIFMLKFFRDTKKLGKKSRVKVNKFIATLEQRLGTFMKKFKEWKNQQ